MIDRNQLLIDGIVHRAGTLAGEIAEMIEVVPECRLAVLAAIRRRLKAGMGNPHGPIVNGDRAAAALTEARALRETNGHVKPKKRSVMSPAQKKAMSKRMKAQWAAAKAAGYTGNALPSYDAIENAKRKAAKKAPASNGKPADAASAA